MYTQPEESAYDGQHWEAKNSESAYSRPTRHRKGEAFIEKYYYFLKRYHRFL